MTGDDLEVLLDDAHFCVVQKPINMVVVKGRGVPRPTLLDLAQEKFGEGVLPVHRLDRVTSGCTCFAKTKFGQQALSEAFRRRQVDKRYLALVEGQPEFKKLAVDARLKRIDNPDARKGALAWQTIDDDGQRALTRLRVLATGARYSVVECRPETGRMHQIRVHLAHVGHPIVGDALYGATSELLPHAVGLHALAISLPKPKGGRAYANAPLPQHWLDILDDDGIDPKDVIDKALSKFGPKDGGAKDAGDGRRPTAKKAPPKSLRAQREEAAQQRGAKPAKGKPQRRRRR